MCFSATASFTLAALLIPAGVCTIVRANRTKADLLPFAVFPLAFGVQQGIEGLVWRGFEGQDATLIDAASFGFLFFSHFFWLAFVPFSVWWSESDHTRRRWLGVLTLVGGLYGLSLFLPVVLSADGFTTVLVNRSIEYKVHVFGDKHLNLLALRVIYASIILGALFASRDRRIRIFGAMVAVSLVVTYAFFVYAFVSIWCFFAAILSIYLAIVIFQDEKAAPAIRGGLLRH